VRCSTKLLTLTHTLSSETSEKSKSRRMYCKQTLCFSKLRRVLHTHVYTFCDDPPTNQE
jgi:hypothetical protein